MKKWLVALAVAAGVAIVLGAGSFLYALTGDTVVIREIPMADITSLQVGSADLKVIFDDQDKVVVTTTRRTLPWVMVRNEDGFLSLGLFDDADPRVFLGFPGLDSGAGVLSDPVSFELHTRTLTRATVAGGGTLETEALPARSFLLSTVSEKACVLRGVDVEELEVEMAGGSGDVVAEGTAEFLSVMNSSSGAFDGSKLVVGDARVIPSGSASTTVNIEGQGPKQY